MQSKLKWSWLIGGVGGIVFCLIVIFFLGMPGTGSSKEPENAVTGQSVAPVQDTWHASENIGLPMRLKIPKIYVDANVEYVKLAPDGAMDVPKRPDDVAWYKPGSRPGEIGSAVIDGHFGIWKNGQGSVFDDLYKLQSGDKIYIEDDQGAIISFVVRGSKIYKPDATTIGIFDSNDGNAHLNLITCDGVWNPEQKSYSQRLIVFADKEIDNN